MTTVGIMSIGTEILRGYTLETNSNFLENYFRDIGFKTLRTCTADDDITSIHSSLDYLSDCDIVVITGGLGPTADDVTREAVSKFYNKKLIRDNCLVEDLKKYFAKRNWEITNSNWKQADKLEGAISIKNDNGTAPGFYFTTDTQLIFVLPGPPNENQPMITQNFATILEKNNYIKGKLLNKIYKIYNIGESNLADLVKTVEFGSYIIGYYFTQGGWVELHISKFVDKEENSLDIQLLNKIEKLFDDNGYFWTDNRSLSEILFEQLKKHNYTISFAESLTGGNVSGELTRLAGVSSVTKGGVISYTNEIKHNVLGVKQSTLDTFTEVSHECAKEMAIGVQNLFNTDIAVSLTGIAGPTGATKNDPIGTVYFGFAIKDKVYSKRFCFTGSRNRVINKSINFALLHAIEFIKQS